MKRSIALVGASMSLTLCAGTCLAQDGQPSKPTQTPKQVAPQQPKVQQPAPKDGQPAMPQQPEVKPGGQAPQGMPEMSPDQMKAMEAMIAFGTPGPEHAQMAKAVGTWNAKTAFRMSPDAPWEESEATEVNSMMLNGLYKKTEFRGNFGGQPFEGFMIEGFNNLTKKYETVWVDSMSTGMMIQTGQFASDGKTITMTGECMDPVTKKMKPLKTVIECHDDNSHTMRMYDVGPDGKQYENMKIEYTRRSDAPRQGEAPMNAPGNMKMEKPAMPNMPQQPGK